MPLVTKEDKVYIEYEIPEEIELKIPKEFYNAMGDMLVGKYGIDILDRLDEFAGGSGWRMVFTLTCEVLKLDWLRNYFKELPWYDQDLFSRIITKRIKD